MSIFVSIVNSATKKAYAAFGRRTDAFNLAPDEKLWPEAFEGGRYLSSTEPVLDGEGNPIVTDGVYERQYKTRARVNYKELQKMADQMPYSYPNETVRATAHPTPSPGTVVWLEDEVRFVTWDGVEWRDFP